MDSLYEDTWKFNEIKGHQGPLNPNHQDYKGSRYNVLIAWEDGTESYIPMARVQDPVELAKYGERHKLLDMPGWKQFKRLAKQQKKLLRLARQAKLRSIRRSPKYRYGFLVPQNHVEAMRLDTANGNSRWRDAEKVELDQLFEYNTSKNLGKQGRPPLGYKKIGVRFVYDVKHDGRHKARMVALGHTRDIPLGSVYSGVVSLRSLRLVLFLAELNGLQIYGTDVGNAYLEAKMKEKIFV